MAGYSGTPLQKKLGLKPGMRCCVLYGPDDYFDLLHPLPDDVDWSERLSGKFDFIHLFVRDQKLFQSKFLQCISLITTEGMIWVSWPKKAAKAETDLDENVIRNFGLNSGLVDVKVCAVDETWSGLKFVYRVKDRRV
jgi:hypothetical protein